MTNSAKQLDRPIRLLACSGSLDGGGSERQLWQLVSKLDRNRFQPDVYLLYRRGPYLARLPDDVRVRTFDDAYPEIRSRVPGYISRVEARHLRNTAAELGSEVIYDRTFHMSLVTGAAFPTGSLPRVSVIVSPPSRDLPQSEKKFLFLKRWLLKRSYQKAASVIAVSEDVADDAASYYRLPRSAFLVMPNPIDLDQVRSLAEDDAIVGGNMSPHSLLVVGRMTPEKGHQAALDAFRALVKKESCPDDAELHLIGDGPLRNQLEQQVRDQQLSSRVKFHGYRINPYPFMRQASVLLVPSRYEGFPNVALESMALGTPLVMNNFGKSAQYVIGDESARGLLIDAQNANTTADVILSAWSDPSVWGQRVQTARRWVEERHSLAAWLEQLQQHLEGVVKRSRSR